MNALSAHLSIRSYSISHKVHTVDVCFGGVSCRFETTDRHWARFLSKKYAPFLSHFRKPHQRYIITPNDSNFQNIKHFVFTNSEATILTPLHCRFFKKFNDLVKMLFAVMLPRDNGIVLHASCLSHNGLGYVFVGPPGAGKSTIARLSPASILMGDDTAIIRRHKNTYFLYWSPFYEKNPIIKHNVSVPLVGIYLLHKAPQNALEPTKNVVSVLRHAWTLLPNRVIPREQTQITKSYWNVALDVADKIPLYYLYFKKSPSFWRLLST